MVAVMQLPLSINVSPKQDFASFIVGSDIPVCHTLENIHATNIPIVFISGPTGSGKSHLLNAVCLAQPADYPFMFLDAATLAPYFQEPGDATEVLNGLESNHLICIDNVDSLLPNPHWQFALFDLINRVLEQGHSIILTSKKRYDDQNFTLPDLRSRLVWGETYHLAPLDDTQIQGALSQYIESKQVKFQDQSLTYLLNHFPRDIKTLKSYIDEIDMHALSHKKAITIPLIKDWFAQLTAHD
jgi:DnaA family protein